MDNILRELFGRTDDDPAVAPAATPGADDAATPDRQATRRERMADPERRKRRMEFIDRYVTGRPDEGFSADEAIAHLAEIRDELSPAEFQLAMVRTLDHLPADQRDEFLAMMRQHKEAADAGAPAGGTAASTAAAQPASTAAGSSGDPFGGLLTGLLGGRGGAGAAGASGFDLGALFDDLRSGGLDAPSAAGTDTPTEADFRALIGSPLGRAVLGGLAAYGLQATAQDDDGQQGTTEPAPPA